MNIFTRTVLTLIVFISFEIGAKTCGDILADPSYFSAKATAETEERALNLARDFLLNQISTTVQSASELRTMEISGEVSTDFKMVSSTSTNIKLKGLRHVVCSQGRRNSEVTVVVYISQIDLEKSAFEVQTQVQEYFNMMEYKENLSIEYLTDVYSAYLRTFLSPISVQVTHQGRTINDAKAYLGIILREHLNAISLQADFPNPGSAGLEEQFSVQMNVGLHAQSAFVYRFDAPSLNAQANLIGGKGLFQYIKRPADVKESIRGYLSFAPINISADLRELLAIHTFSKEVVVEIDYSRLISVDFNIERKGNNLVCTPILQHLSPRAFEWRSGNRQLSSNQILAIPSDEAPEKVTLIVNGISHLAVEKSLRNTSVSTRPVAQRDAPKNSQTLPNSAEEINLNSIKSEFGQIETFSSLQTTLMDIRNSGRGTWGRKADFMNPDLCWVFLVNADTKKVEVVLTPNSGGRTDIRTNKLHTNFENEFKGYIAIWVDLIH